MEDYQQYFQDIYGRQGSASELAAVSGMTPEQVRQTLTSSLATFNANQANQAPGADVRAALQSALPGYNVTDADVNWWTQQGGVQAVENQWPTPYRHEIVPTLPGVNPQKAGDVTITNFQKHPGQEAAATRNSIRDAVSQLQTQADLDRFLATSPYTAEQISEVFPEWGVADLKREQSRAFREMQGGSKISESLASQLDAELMPTFHALRLTGGGDYSKLYSDPAAAQQFLAQRAADRAYAGPEVAGYREPAKQASQATAAPAVETWKSKMDESGAYAPPTAAEYIAANPNLGQTFDFSKGDLGGYTEQQIKDYIDWQSSQPNWITGQTNAEFAAQRGINLYNPQSIEQAIGALEQAKGTPGAEPWENPNWRTALALDRAAREAQRVDSLRNPGPFSAGPGPAPEAQDVTLDPVYAQVLGGMDPVTAMRVANLMRNGTQYYDQNDPRAMALLPAVIQRGLSPELQEKLFPKYEYQGIAALPGSQAQAGQTTAAGQTVQPSSGAVDFSAFSKNPTFSNFGGFLKTPDLTYTQIRDAYDLLSKQTNLTADQRKTLDDFGQKFKQLEGTWSRYQVDPYQAETLYNQINKITEAAGGKNWQGSWMSGGENAQREAAARLTKLGVDNLSDLKVVPKYQDASAAEMYQGQQVLTDDQGKKYIPNYDSESGVIIGKQYLPAGAQTQIQALDVETYSGEGGDGSYTHYTPLTEEELKTYDPKTGTFQRVAGKNLIDASTGKVIAEKNRLNLFGKSNDDDNFVIDYYDTGNFFKGKDKTFGITFNKEGVPIPYITTEKTGLVTTPILPMLLSLVGAPMLSGIISGALPGAAVAASGATAAIPATALNIGLSNALSGGILSGIGSSLQGGDFGRGFLGGALGSGIGSLVGNALPTDFVASNPNLARGISSTAGNIGRTAIMGGDVGDALLGGIVNTGISSALGPIGEAAGLTKDQMNLFSGVVAPLLTKGKLTPNDLMKLAVQFKQNATPYSQ